MSILLGIDLGDRRIGVAAGDTERGTVTPLVTLRRSTPQADADVLARLCSEHRASELVVGLPLHMDGTESLQSERTREWVAAIGPRLEVPLSLQDERLSSESARRSLGKARRGRSGGPPSSQARSARRARVDREAAAIIVQAALDERARRAIDAQRASMVNA